MCRPSASCRCGVRVLCSRASVCSDGRIERLRARCERCVPAPALSSPALPCRPCFPTCSLSLALWPCGPRSARSSRVLCVRCLWVAKEEPVALRDLLMFKASNQCSSLVTAFLVLGRLHLSVSPISVLMCAELCALCCCVFTTAPGAHARQTPALRYETLLLPFTMRTVHFDSRA